MVPERIGQYRVISALGAGGMGEVFLAHDEKLDRRVAIKRLKRDSASDGHGAERLLIEARAVARLDHPNICGIYEVGEDPSGAFIVMPVVEGRTLEAVIADHPLPPQEALDIAAQIADALAAAHREGILHRDIKPGNVIVNARGQARVMDFGLAKFIGSSSTSTDATVGSPTVLGGTVGTAAYMSPEQGRGERLDVRSDVFSLGATLYQMVCGRRPFEGASFAAQLAATQTQEPAPVARLCPGAPDELQRILSKAMRKAPGERYQTAEDFAVDLRALSRALQSGTVSTGASSIAVSAGRRASWKTAVLAGIVIGLTLAVAVVVWPRVTTRADVASAAKSFDSLAVLPFVNNSGSTDKEYIADGITESLIRSLAQVPKLTVMSRNAVFHFKGQSDDAQKIAGQLGVQAVMTGKISQVDNQLVVDVWVMDARSGAAILTRQYTQPSARVPSMESDIAQDVARKLESKMSGETERQLGKMATANPEAYQLFLKARFFGNKDTPEGLHQAIDLYKQAIALDPNYALSYSGLAQAYLELGIFYDAPRDVMPLARQYANRALEADKDLVDARIILGLVALNYDWDWDAAAKATTTTAGMLPQAVAMFSCATHLLDATGHAADATASIRGALARDPLSTVLHGELGCSAYYQHRYDDALLAYRETLTLEPNDIQSLWGLGRVLDHLGRYDEALAEMTKVPLSAAPPILVSEIGCAYAGLGRQKEARGILDRLAQMARTVFVDPYLVATVHLALKDKPRAFDSLQKAYDLRSGFLVALTTEPKWDPIRTDPKFKDLVKRVGF